MTTIAIVDYGMGNLNSVEQALHYVCTDPQKVIVATDSASIDRADKIVFPGQGTAGACMQAIKDKDLAPALVRAAQEKPFLGICMGLQVLMDRSDESDGTACLQVFAGDVKHLSHQAVAQPNHKIPHMGWNQVQQKKQHPLWHNIENDAYFYFVHSYCACPESEAVVAATSEYGEDFVCAISQAQVFAVQFHPEKSTGAGLNILKNFVNWNGNL